MNAMVSQYSPHVDRPLPETLTTADAKLVYLYLSIEEDATIDELHAALGMKKITLYPLLRTLTAAGHVDCTGSRYVCRQRSG